MHSATTSTVTLTIGRNSTTFVTRKGSGRASITTHLGITMDASLDDALSQQAAMIKAFADRGLKITVDGGC